MTSLAPSDAQLRSLMLMQDVLFEKVRACGLAQSLWEFFAYQLYFFLRDADNDSSLLGVERPDDPGNPTGKVRLRISVPNTFRRAEALVHELLHAELIRLGYPKFRIFTHSDYKWQVAGSIINLADHVVTLPLFLSLGYSKDRFLGPSEAFEKGLEIEAEIARIAPLLISPHGYETAVSAYLRRENIEHESECHVPSSAKTADVAFSSAPA